MKSLFIFIAVIAINIPVWSQAYEYQRADKSPKDAFPLQATWMNVQAPVTMEQLQLKAVMLVFTTDNCPAGLNNAMLAQEYCRSHSAIQTIIVWLKGKAHDRTAMTEELRAYGIYEPVVVVDNLDAFKSSSVTKLPMICVQEEAGKTAYQATSYYELPAVRLSHLDDLIDGTAGNRTFSLSRLSSDDLLFTRAEPLIAFPSHIDAMSDGSGLWVTDRPHHRIALLEPDGEVNTVIGSTSKGNQDGRFSEAKFNYPGGVSFMPATNTLYIADTYNHRICAADLETQKVSTLLGGKQPVSKTDKGKTITGIGLPVDVLAGNKSLYFVSAWDMGVYAWDLVAEKLTQLAVLQPQMPDSLQPVAPINMAIYTDSSMAVACSNGQWFEVFINGGIQELKFNDREGNAVYPSSISRSGSTLYAADTHRHGIWEVKEGVCTEFSGFGGEGFASGKLKKCLYNRPFDLSVAKEKLWVSDGYNHQLRWMKLGKKKMNTYLLRDYEVLTRLGDAPNTGQRVTLEPVSAGPGINRITIRYNHPGYLVVQSGKNEAHTDGSEGVKITGFRPAEGILELEVDADKLPGQFQLEFYLTLSPETAPSQLYLKTIFLTLPIASGGEKTGHSLKFEPAIGWN